MNFTETELRDIIGTLRFALDDFREQEREYACFGDAETSEYFGSHAASVELLLNRLDETN
jgi:hypothetical protein